MRHEPTKRIAVGFRCPICNDARPEVVEMLPLKGACALKCVAPSCGWDWVESSDKCLGCGRYDTFRLVDLSVENSVTAADIDPNDFEVDEHGFYKDPDASPEDLAPAEPVAGLKCDGCGAYA